MEDLKSHADAWSAVKRTFTVVIERDPDGGFIASVPELPGCHSQADTLDALRSHIREAIDLYLEGEDPDTQWPEFVALERVEVVD